MSRSSPEKGAGSSGIRSCEKKRSIDMPDVPSDSSDDDFEKDAESIEFNQKNGLNKHLPIVSYEISDDDMSSRYLNKFFKKLNIQNLVKILCK